MATTFFIIGAVTGAIIGAVIMSIVIEFKRDKARGNIVGVVSAELLAEWQAHDAVGESLSDDTYNELGLDLDGEYEIDTETGVVTQNDPSG